MDTTRVFSYSVSDKKQCLSGIARVMSRSEVQDILLDHLALADIKTPVSWIILEMESRAAEHDQPSTAETNSKTRAQRRTPKHWANRIVTRELTETWHPEPSSKPVRKPSNGPDWAPYCIVISTSPEIVMLQMPEERLPWKIVCRRVHQVMRTQYQIPAKEVYDIEAIAGYSDGQSRSEQEAIARAKQAFAGDMMAFPEFSLYAWDKTLQEFVPARPATASICQESR